ncbi:MAG: divalent-cation tolerance protein CutA [Alphaproteobacteria bacterium]
MIVIYCTYPNCEEARQITQILLEERLVACANILPEHESLYWWDGAVERAAEVAVIYKSRAGLFDAVKERVIGLHSYDVPCVVSWSIENGHRAFLQWIESETRR